MVAQCEPELSLTLMMQSSRLSSIRLWPTSPIWVHDSWHTHHLHTCTIRKLVEIRWFRTRRSSPFTTFQNESHGCSKTICRVKDFVLSDVFSDRIFLTEPPPDTFINRTFVACQTITSIYRCMGCRISIHGPACSCICRGYVKVNLANRFAIFFECTDFGYAENTSPDRFYIPRNSHPVLYATTLESPSIDIATKSKSTAPCSQRHVDPSGLQSTSICSCQG